MERLAQNIAWYHRMFLACLILCLIFLVVAAALFFALHIRDILEELTGRRARKRIRKLKEENQR